MVPKEKKTAKKKNVTKIYAKNGKWYVKYRGKTYEIKTKIPQDADIKEYAKEIVQEVREIRKVLGKPKRKSVRKAKEPTLEELTTAKEQKQPIATGVSGNTLAESYRITNDREQRLKLDKEEKERKDKKDEEEKKARQKELEDKKRILELEVQARSGLRPQGAIELNEEEAKLTYKIEEVRGVLDRLNQEHQNTIQQQKNELKEILQEKDRLESENKTTSGELFELNKEYTETKLRASEQKGEISKLEDVLKDLEKKKQGLEGENKKLNDANEELRQKLLEKQNQYNQLVDEYNQLDDDLDEAVTELESKAQEIVNLNEQKNKLIANNTASRTELERINADLIISEDRFIEVNKQYLKLSDEIKKKNTELEKVQGELDDAIRKYIEERIRTSIKEVVFVIYRLLNNGQQPPSKAKKPPNKKDTVPLIIQSIKDPKKFQLVLDYFKQQDIDFPTGVTDLDYDPDNYKELIQKAKVEKAKETVEEAKASSSKAEETADEIAEDILEDIIGAIGAGRYGSLGGLYNVEIDEYMKELKPKGFKGTYSVDELAKIPLGNQDNFSFVMNTEPSTIPNGHWVSVFVTPSTIEYFDPFGEEPKPNFVKNIMKLIKKWRPENVYQMKVNSVKRQKNNTTNCGYFAMKFLNDRYKGKTFKEATGFKIIEDSMKGEKEIKEFKEKLKDFGYVGLKKGKGIISEAYKWVTGNYPGAKNIKNLVDKKGNQKLKNIIIWRTPIKQALVTLANLVSGGKLDQARRDLNYDKLFHLFMIITLSDDTSFRLEKNQALSVSNNTNVRGDENGDFLTVPGVEGKNIKLGDALTKTKNLMGEKNFFVYSALDHNCQEFVSSFLKANGLYNAELGNFVNQDVKEIAKKTPGYFSSVADVVTDIASLFSG